MRSIMIPLILILVLTVCRGSSSNPTRKHIGNDVHAWYIPAKLKVERDGDVATIEARKEGAEVSIINRGGKPRLVIYHWAGPDQKVQTALLESMEKINLHVSPGNPLIVETKGAPKVELTREP